MYCQQLARSKHPQNMLRIFFSSVLSTEIAQLGNFESES